MSANREPNMTSIEERVNKQHLELVVEVRALTAAVAQLHTIFVKRRVLFWCIGILSTLVLGLATVAYLNHRDVITQHRDVGRMITKLTDNCRTRNRQVEGTQTFLAREQRIQDESQQVSAQILSQLHLSFTPAQVQEQEDLARRAIQALQDWQASQPRAVSCNLK